VVREVQERGAGRSYSIAWSDGVRKGYDIEQLRKVREVCGSPWWHPRCGRRRAFRDVFAQAAVDAALAASVFHSGSIANHRSQARPACRGIAVRPPAAEMHS